MSPPLVRLVTVAALAMLAMSCGSGDPTNAATSSTRVQTAQGEALLYGDGRYGVVLAHGAAYDAASWEEQANAIADAGHTALAVEDISADGIGAGVRYLSEERGIESVAMVGASAGAGGALELAATRPELLDQLILLSPNSVVDGLGDEPKLFIASEDETVAGVSRTLAANGPGASNEVLLVPGDTHAQGLFETEQADRVLQAILDRLEQFADA
ncbi:MAG: alpha/beta hydrolase [Microthrixaceae bacterium]